MKINDKSLCAYACYRDSVDKEGFLDKKGEVNHGYKRRWFALKGNLLFYFEKPGDKQCLGVIILENCSIEISDSERHSFCVRYQGSCGTRTYILCADNEKDMEKWMKALTSASYSYTEMILKEFEKTLANLKSKTASINDDDCLIIDDSGEFFDEIDTKNVQRKSKSKSMKMLARKFYPENNKSPSTGKKKVSAENLISYTRESRTLDVPGRSRSTENLQKIQRSPKLLRKKMARSPATSRSKTFEEKRDETYDFVNQVDSQPDLDSSFFEYLHAKYGASIWTKIDIESSC